MNDTPAADGGGSSSGSQSDLSGVSAVGDGMKAAALYVEAEELELFAQAMAEHEEALNKAMEMFSEQHAQFTGFHILPTEMVETYDASTLQLGFFPEAVDCIQTFREVTYKGSAISTNHVGAGQQVCGEVTRRTRDNYLNTDDSINIDNQSLQREIESAGSDSNGLLMDDSAHWNEGGGSSE